MKLTSETTLRGTCLRIQNRLNRFQRAWWKFIIIPFISRRGTSEHNEIAILATRCTLIWIVLKDKRKRSSIFHGYKECVHSSETLSDWWIVAWISDCFILRNNCVFGYNKSNPLATRFSWYKCQPPPSRQWHIHQNASAFVKCFVNKINIINHRDESEANEKIRNWCSLTSRNLIYFIRLTFLVLFATHPFDDTQSDNRNGVVRTEINSWFCMS